VANDIEQKIKAKLGIGQPKAEVATSDELAARRPA
jgi:recombination protein RecA